MVHEHVVARVRLICAERAAARAGVRTPGQVMRLRGDVRRKLRECFGPFPERTPLNAHVTGTIERPHYRIETVLFESRPSFPVTANLYLPSGSRGPWPCVLGLCGHAPNGKAYGPYQTFMQNLACRGFVGLILDPVSQGERLQYPDCPASRRPSGCCQEHDMMGRQMGLTGEFFGAWRLWDAIRGLDYLLSRPEADPTRVGVTGSSGGGALTTYINAFDDRITMAAPNCFVTRYLHNLENELTADAEQIPPGLLAAGLDMADFLLAQIPRPTILLGENNDAFDRRGLEATYAELRHLYSILGAEENVRIFIGPTDHDYNRLDREAMYSFFQTHARVKGPRRELRMLKPEKEQVLWVTPRGQVHPLGVRRVRDFTREKALDLAGRRKKLSDAGLRIRIAERLQLPERTGTPYYRVLQPQPVTEARRQFDSRFAVETEPGILAMLHALPRSGEFFHLPKVTDATLYVPHLSAVREIAGARGPRPPLLFAVDVRGVGELTAQGCRYRESATPFGPEYLYASHGLMLNESYCGRRVFDLLRVLDLLQSKGCRKVHLVGRGQGAIIATYAACQHPLVTKVTLHNTLISYHELTQAPTFRWPMSSLVFGVLNDFDLPDCYRLLARKRLRLVAPWDAWMRPWRPKDLAEHLESLGLEWLSVRPAAKNMWHDQEP